MSKVLNKLWRKAKDQVSFEDPSVLMDGMYDALTQANSYPLAVSKLTRHHDSRWPCKTKLGSKTSHW